MKLPLTVGLIALAVVLAVGFYATDFTIYLGNDPTACGNCHVMDAAYEGWYHSGHQRDVKCVECHAPHNIVGKYFIKAVSGINDVYHFSLGLIPDPLRAKPYTRRIIQANCIRCHAETVSMIADGGKDAGRFCFDCHRTAAHGARGVSFLPYQDTGMYDPSSRSLEEK